MIIRSLDSTHDWQFGKGKQSYEVKAPAIAENIQTRLLSFVNDCFFDRNAGVDWFRLLGDKGTKDEITLSCRAIILQSFGVVRVNSLSAALDANRHLTLSYNIDTIYTTNLNQSLEILNA